MVTRAAVRFGSSLALFGLALVAGALMGSPDSEFWPRATEGQTPARFALTRPALPPVTFETPVLTVNRTLPAPPKRDAATAVVRQERLTYTPAPPKPRPASIAQP